MATTAKEAIGEQPLAVRVLLACGVIAGPLFTISWLVQGASRADYDPLRHPISSLSIGELGWIQVATFVITGLLVLAFAIGLRRVLPNGSTWGPLLIGLAGIGLIGAGLFVTDPLNGYPSGTELVPTVRTALGQLHDLFGIPVFLGLPIACLVFGRRFARMGERGWAIYSVFSGVAMFVIFFLARLGFRQTPGFAEFAGLFQRLSLIVGFAWITLLALRFMRR